MLAIMGAAASILLPIRFKSDAEQAEDLEEDLMR